MLRATLPAPPPVAIHRTRISISLVPKLMNFREENLDERSVRAFDRS